MEDNQNLYRDVEIIFGRKHQAIKAVEELSELQQAICKIQLADVPTNKMYDNLFEEIADVEIMIEQVKRLYECSDEVAIRKKMKIDRLHVIVKGNKKLIEDKLKKVNQGGN